MKVLIIGGGGREHTIAWKLNQSPRIKRLYCAPGNGGIASLAECVPISATDLDGIVNFAKENKIDLTVVAPDDPLAMGLVDKLEENGLRAFGPRQSAAEIESSKLFAKKLMKKYGIPTAQYQSFEEFDSAVKYLNQVDYPVVIKADGLALGKGVIIASNRDEAEKAVKDMLLDNRFGEAGKRILIEEFLIYPEVSILAFTDGKTIVPMVAHRIIRGSSTMIWPNTGGMGAFLPAITILLKLPRYGNRI